MKQMKTRHRARGKTVNEKVIRRRKRRRFIEASDRDVALEECARELTNGLVAIIHHIECPSMNSGVCDCAAELVGPAVRGVWQ